CPRMGAVEEPKCSWPFHGVRYASTVPYTIATAQPMIRAQRWNHRVYRPATIAGKVCRIQTPPSSCRLMENVLLNESTKISAPSFTTSDVQRATRVCSAGSALGRKYSL